jgi:copper ion binding protein
LNKENIMKIELSVDGMSCEHCVAHVTQALEGVAGVKSAKVSLRKKNAVVKCDDNVSVDALKAAVVDAGYQAEQVA